MYGKHHTEESKEKNRQSHLEIYAEHPELRKKISNRQLALFASPEGEIVKRKISNTLKSKPGATKGYIYVHKDSSECQVPPEKLDEYLSNGYERGRSKEQADRLRLISSYLTPDGREAIVKTSRKKKGGHWLVNEAGDVKYLIDQEDINSYLAKGYIIGRKYHAK